MTPNGVKHRFTAPVEIAAAYLFYLCRHHPFMDGNQRTASATCLVFLSANGLLPEETLDADGWEQPVREVAGSRVNREETTERLKKFLARDKVGK